MRSEATLRSRQWVETEIVTDKIGIRALGLLEDLSQDDALHQEAIDVIERQVESVLRSSAFGAPWKGSCTTEKKS